MTHALAGMVLEAWADLDRAIEGLSREDAAARRPALDSIASHRIA